jgi:hypothetical protein
MGFMSRLIAVCLWPALASVGSAMADAPKKLAVVEARFQQYEDGPPVPPGYAFIAGETAFFTFRVRGFAVSDDDKISLQYQFDALDSRGVRLMETVKQNVQASLSPEDKNWLPKVNQSVAIPPLAEPGAYRIVVSVADVLGKTEAKDEFPFQVRGRKIEPSDKLVVRNFRFLRQEEDKDPLAAAAYKGGDTLWARFEITGYKFGDKNLIHLEYGLAVAAPDGKVLFSQPEPGVIQEKPFYPNRYEPGVVSLAVNPGTTAGDYVLVISVRDVPGNQTCEAREKFKVE